MPTCLRVNLPSGGRGNFSVVDSNQLRTTQSPSFVSHSPTKQRPSRKFKYEVPSNIPFPPLELVEFSTADRLVSYSALRSWGALEWPHSSVLRAGTGSVRDTATAQHIGLESDSTNELKHEQSRKLNIIQICLSPKKHPLSVKSMDRQISARWRRRGVNGPITMPITGLLLKSNCSIQQLSCAKGSLSLHCFGVPVNAPPLA